MKLVVALIVLVNALYLVAAQNDGRYRPPSTTQRPVPRYRPYRPYDPFNQNRNVNDGRYTGRNDGRYSGGGDGRYVPRNDGRYVHQDVRYQHIAGPSGSGASPYVGGAGRQGPSGAGGGRQGPSGSGSGANGAAGAGSGASSGANSGADSGVDSGAGAGAAAPAAAPVPVFVPTTAVPALARQVQSRVAPQPVDADGWKIIRLENNVRKDGYQYIFETQNGINAEESGRIESTAEGGEGLRSQGFYEYVGDDGQVYRVDYVADTNGFLPQGDHIPKVPPAIEKLLKYLASQPN